MEVETEEDKLDSIVDQYFSFIDEDFTIDETSYDQEAIEFEEEPSFSVRSTTPTGLDHPSQVDQVLDQHFSFLQGEQSGGEDYEDFYSLDRTDSLTPIATSPYGSFDLKQGHMKKLGIGGSPILSLKSKQIEDEPIYSNLWEMQLSMATKQAVIQNGHQTTEEENPYENVYIDREKLNSSSVTTVGASSEFFLNKGHPSGPSAVIRIPACEGPLEIKTSLPAEVSVEGKTSTIYFGFNPINDVLADVSDQTKELYTHQTSSNFTNKRYSSSGKSAKNTYQDIQSYLPSSISDHEIHNPDLRPEYDLTSAYDLYPVAKVECSPTEYTDISLNVQNYDPVYKTRQGEAMEYLGLVADENLRKKYTGTSGGVDQGDGTSEYPLLSSCRKNNTEKDGTREHSEQSENERSKEGENSGKILSQKFSSDVKHADGFEVMPSTHSNTAQSPDIESVMDSLSIPETPILSVSQGNYEEASNCSTTKAEKDIVNSLLCLGVEDLKKLHSLDREIELLENEAADQLSPQETFRRSSGVSLVEAINSSVLSSETGSQPLALPQLLLNVDMYPVGDRTEPRVYSSNPGTVRREQNNFVSQDVTDFCQLKMNKNETRQLGPDSLVCPNGQGQVKTGTNHGRHQSSSLPGGFRRTNLSAADCTPSTSDQDPSTSGVEQDDSKSVSAAISGVIRRSMRRMKHIRLSGKRSKRKAKCSEETEVRRQVPDYPEVGLPSVRAPSSSAVLLPTILSALTPPREALPRPEETINESTTTRNIRFPSEEPADTISFSRSSENVSASSDTTGATSVAQSSVSPARRCALVPPERGRLIPPRTPPASGDAEEPRLRPTEGIGDFSDPRFIYLNNNRNRSGTTTNTNNNNNNNNQNIHNSNNNNSNNFIANNSNINNSSRNSNDNHNSTTVLRSDRNVPSSLSSRPSVASLSSEHQEMRTTRGVRRDSLLVNRATSQRTSGGSTGGFLPPKRSLWPHANSGLFASLPVTLNVFNVSRFAVMGAQFGWQFPIQWLIISLVIGVPLMTFHAAIGQTIGGSVVDMWSISPIFQGVGLGLLIVEAAMGVYCCVPVAWLFTFFRDSFDLRRFRCLLSVDCSTPQNLSKEINHYVSGYFSSNVLQRPQDGVSLLNTLGSIKFDLSFNIALIWVITFLALSRGVRSYGKVCYLVFLLPVVCIFSVGFYLVYWSNHQITVELFKDIFLDRHSWMAASREAFIVWGLHGAVFHQMAASNKKRHPLWRDTTVITFVAILSLGLSSVCGIVFASVMNEYELIYVPSSFETEPTRAFLKAKVELVGSNSALDHQPTVSRYVNLNSVYDNFYVGIRIRDEMLGMPRLRPRNRPERSGYNALRFLTEMFPALLFAKDPPILSVWPPLFYLGLLLSGLALQLSVWHTVVQGLIRINYRLLAPWETFITFCTCLFAFSASLLLATGLGIHIIYFLDYVIGCVWWIMILQLILVFAVLFVRGKPYTAQSIAKNMFGTGRCCSTSWITAPVAFSWTIMVPVGLLVLSISSFKTGNYREVFAWESGYWSIWTCQLASGLQLFPLLLVPLVGLIQTVRYLANPKRDLFERIQHLYRPPPFRGFENPYDEDAQMVEDQALYLPYNGSDDPPEERDAPPPPRPFIDPPPKYTPPPSYSTATGLGFSKLFSHSLRRSMRRLRETLTASNQGAASSVGEPYIPPPDYTQPPLRETSPIPPQYATLDPIRVQRAFNRLRSPKIDSRFELRRLATEPEELTQGVDTNPRGESVFTLRRQDVPSTHLSSFRLPRCLSASTRRSVRGRGTDSTDSFATLIVESVSRESVGIGRSLSNIELTTHSEA